MTMHRYATFAEFGCCLILAVVAAQKSNEEAAAPAPPTATSTLTEPPAESLGKLDAATQGTSIRASQLIGMNIENADKKSVGQVRDVVLNAKTGEIQYVAVTYGGFLGVGDKLFAVPFEAFECRPDANNASKHQLVLNVTQAQLEGEAGFDEDHWPNFADPQFASELYERYQVTRRLRIEGDRRGIDIDVRRNGVDIEVERK